jgi:glycosyltransferase involved in cell wall biosynthesis
MTIVGQGVEMALTAPAKSAGVESEVRLLGIRKDIPAILADADLFLSTSTSEGMPVSLLEAMASGIPCVAYAFPSLTEINAEDSLVDAVPIGEIDRAVERIKFWNDNRDEAIAFGAAASANIAKRFGSTASAAQWEAFLEGGVMG